MKVLYLEDNLIARRNVLGYFRGRFDIGFIETVTAMEELLYRRKGYELYGAVVVDLSLNMTQLTKEKIKKRIPELNRDDVPTTCVGVDIPLYGLDFYKYVIAKREETKPMVREGRVILFSGHAAKVRSHGLYDENNPVFEHTKLIDRADSEDYNNATHQLYTLLLDIEQRMAKV